MFGSLIEDRGGLIVTAGRQSAIDGGINVYKLAAHDGSIAWQARLWTDPDAPVGEEDSTVYRSKTRNRRVNELLVHNGKAPCLWITPLKNEYGPKETVDIERAVFASRAMKFSVPSKEELRDVKDATWIWSASSAELLSRRTSGVGRHDQSGVNYADLNATKICLVDRAATDAAKTLYALKGGVSRIKSLRGGLMRLSL